MAQRAVAEMGMSIRLACQTFQISECCYRYRSKLSSENAVIADWLLRLTHNQRNWGFGLCYLYLRNVRGYLWNHKRVYRIYCASNPGDASCVRSRRRCRFRSESTSPGRWTSCTTSFLMVARADC